jgi:ribosomal protein L16 Arg81 hydroxylase
VAPVPPDVFLDRYWGKEPLVVHRSDPDYYSGLFSLEDFDDAITRDPSYVKLANATTKKNLSYKPSSSGLEAVLADFRGGGTIVLDQLHQRDPKLSILCRALVPEFSHRFQTNLYLTPPNGKGFSPHWDNHDVFILQVVGSKTWHLEKERRAHPRKGEAMGDEGRELKGDIHTFSLGTGDLIYIPRGFVHAAECGAEASLHITLGVSGVYWEDLLQAVIRTQMRQDHEVAGLLPFGFMNAPQDGLTRRTSEILGQLMDETFLKAAVQDFRDACVTGYKLDTAGQIVDMLRPKPLLISDIVGPRRGMVYQIHPANEGTRLNFGARSITFLDIFSEAVPFALGTPSFSPSQLPGDLADVEKIAFVERLIEEGLVVRK